VVGVFCADVDTHKFSGGGVIMFEVEQRLRQINDLSEGESPEVTVTKIDGNRIYHIHDSASLGIGEDLESDFVPLEEIDKSPREFRVGDRVKYTSGKHGDEDSNPVWGKSQGEIKGTVDQSNYNEGGDIWVEVQWDNGRHNVYHPEDLVLIEGGDSMDKYSELKQRIEALKNGWDKEADDILHEIRESSNPAFILWIPMHKNDGIIHITSLPPIPSWDDSKASFNYNSQCSKMSAFKSALLWLLEHSDTPKDDKQDKIDALQKQADELQKQIKELRGGE